MPRAAVSHRFFLAERVSCYPELEDLRAQVEIVAFERAAITKCNDLSRERIVWPASFGIIYAIYPSLNIHGNPWRKFFIFKVASDFS